jgi:hypothetical protein
MGGAKEIAAHKDVGTAEDIGEQRLHSRYLIGRAAGAIEPHAADRTASKSRKKFLPQNARDTRSIHVKGVKSLGLNVFRGLTVVVYQGPIGLCATAVGY